MEEEITKSINLQKAFIKINEKENLDFISSLLSSTYINEKPNLDRIILMIQASLVAKPQFHQKYIEVLVKLIPSMKKQYNLDELTTLQPRYFLFSNKYIATIMIQNNLFTIEEYREKYPNKYVDFNLVDLNQKEQTIFSSIKNDDVESFQQILSRTNLDINKKLEYNEHDFFYPEANIPWNLAYIIEFVAYCGSISIFKYLLSNDVNLYLKNLLYYAYCGGNYDIIHLIEDSTFNFEYDKSQLGLATIEHHSNELVNYLIENLEVSIENDRCIVKCVECNNIEILKLVLENIEDKSSNLFKVAVKASVTKGNLDSLKYLIDIQKVNIIDKDFYNGASLFKEAVRNYHVEMIKYIYLKIGENINNCDDSGEF